MRIDHVIYAARDLDEAAARIERELGLLSLPGGRHEGLGTCNRIVPLGGGYLELLAVADEQEAATSDFGRGLLDRLQREGDGLMAWVVAVDDAAAVARRLGTEVTTIRRAGLSARLTGVAEAMREPFLPVFISRDPGVPDPGAAGDAGGITWIELSGDADRLAHWLGGADLPVHVVPGPPAVTAIGIGTAALREPSAMEMPTPDDPARAPVWENYIAAQAAQASLARLPPDALAYGVEVRGTDVRLVFQLSDATAQGLRDIEEIRESLEDLVGDGVTVTATHEVLAERRVHPHDGVCWVFLARAPYDFD